MKSYAQFGFRPDEKLFFNFPFSDQQQQGRAQRYFFYLD